MSKIGGRYFITSSFVKTQTYSLHIAITPKHSLVPTSQEQCWRTRVTQKKPNWQPLTTTGCVGESSATLTLAQTYMDCNLSNPQKAGSFKWAV